jgi:hypothetical protein
LLDRDLPCSDVNAEARSKRICLNALEKALKRPRHRRVHPRGARHGCGKEWTQLNYGWWTVLEPHLTPSSKKETELVRQRARQNLEDENNALFAKFRQMRGQQ